LNNNYQTTCILYAKHRASPTVLDKSVKLILLKKFRTDLISYATSR